MKVKNGHRSKISNLNNWKLLKVAQNSFPHIFQDLDFDVSL